MAPNSRIFTNTVLNHYFLSSSDFCCCRVKWRREKRSGRRLGQVANLSLLVAELPNSICCKALFAYLFETKKDFVPFLHLKNMKAFK